MKYSVMKGNIIEKIDGEVVIFDSEKSVFFTLNNTATYIFEKIKSGLQKEKIIPLMVKKYRITEKIASSDFDELVQKLIGKKIISFSSIKK
jgi:hypothetical protein